MLCSLCSREAVETAQEVEGGEGGKLGHHACQAEAWVGFTLSQTCALGMLYFGAMGGKGWGIM